MVTTRLALAFGTSSFTQELANNDEIMWPEDPVNPIDRNLPVAAYFQIAHEIKSRIGNGEWKSTRKLPPETKLAHDYGVSRMTVRQALAELEKDGLVIRKQGVGTFVGAAASAHERATVTMSSSLSISQALKDLGHVPEVQIVTSEVIPVPSDEIAHALQLDESDSVVFFQRNFMVENQCVVVSRSFLPHHLVGSILNDPLEGDSIQLTLRNRFGIVDERCQRWIEAVRATDDDAALLEIEVGAPLISLTSLFLDYKSQPIDYVCSLWPGDYMRIMLEQRMDFPNSYEDHTPQEAGSQMVLLRN